MVVGMIGRLGTIMRLSLLMHPIGMRLEGSAGEKSLTATVDRKRQATSVTNVDLHAIAASRTPSWPVGVAPITQVGSCPGKKMIRLLRMVWRVAIQAANIVT